MDLLPLSLSALEAATRNWAESASLLALAAAIGASAYYRRLFRLASDEERNKRELIDNLAEGIYRSTIDGKQLSANPALVKLNGYASEAEQLQGVKDIAAEWYVDPGRREAFRSALWDQGRVDGFVSEIFRHKTRERIWITESARLVRHRKTGQPLFYEGSVHEITETVEKLALEERFRKLTSHLPGALFQIEIPRVGRARMAYLSPGITSITGHSHAEHVADPGLFNRLIVEADCERYDRSVQEAQEKSQPWDVEFRIRARCGKEKWLRVMASLEQSADLLTWHGYVTDISVRKVQELEIAELAYFDPLTRLPNRRLFMQRLTALAEREDGRGALLFIDLDNFKTLNDTQGHETGDAYLVQVAERLRACVSPSDTVARLGGDEFVVILGTDLADAGAALRHAITAAHRIVAALHRGFALGVLDYVGSASVGVVGFDGGAAGPEELLKRADVTMYQAKAAGRNGVALFDPATLERETARYRLLQELRAAVAEAQFELCFAPQVDDERRLKGAQAAIMWRHPTRGTLEAGEFLPLAEQFGLSSEIGRQVLRMGLGALAAWRNDAATANLRLALPLSLAALVGDAVPELAAAIGRDGLDPASLTLEMMEDIAARNREEAAARMAELRKLGLNLALDKFGTGYSSLATLRQMPFSEIKVDAKFVGDIEASDEGRSLVRTVLAMARLMRLNTVADGVANIRQEAFLRAYGCNLLQGSLYGAAMSAEEFLIYACRHRAVPVSVTMPEVRRAAG